MLIKHHVFMLLVIFRFITKLLYQLETIAAFYIVMLNNAKENLNQGFYEHGIVNCVHPLLFEH